MRAEGICQEENANLSVIVQAWHLGASSHSSSQLEPGTFQPPPAASSQAGTQKEHPGWINLILGVLLYPHSRRRCQQRLTDDAGMQLFKIFDMDQVRQIISPPACSPRFCHPAGGRPDTKQALIQTTGTGQSAPRDPGRASDYAPPAGF